MLWIAYHQILTHNKGKLDGLQGKYFTEYYLHQRVDLLYFNA